MILSAVAGIALRVYPSSSFTGIGYDEGLYRGYVTDLINHGITSYPDFAEHYVERQQKLPAAILPPTRFLYIFSAYLWHEISGAEALVSLHRVSCLFSILLLFAASAFTWRLAGPAWALAILALMSCAPTQIHMAQHALIEGAARQRTPATRPESAKPQEERACPRNTSYASASPTRSSPPSGPGACRPFEVSYLASYQIQT